jgi:hypothetical protein
MYSFDGFSTKRFWPHCTAAEAAACMCRGGQVCETAAAADEAKLRYKQCDRMLRWKKSPETKPGPFSVAFNT